MNEARGYTCPSCGAIVAERARACSFCAAPVASVRCAHCFDMNTPDALHCAGCGRELGLEPLTEPSALTCPSCGSRLESLRGRSGTLLDCTGCGGPFAEHALVRELLELREAYTPITPHKLASENPLSQPLRYVKCPACGDIMNRRNFGKTSGIIVDVCHRHGIWFDRGELPRILAFVQNGGLADAQRRELRELASNDAYRTELRALRMTDHEYDGSGFDSAHISGEPSLYDDLEQATAALLSYVKEKLFHR